MKAKEIGSVFEEISPQEIGVQGDIDGQVLGLRFGDADTEITGIGVAWYLAKDVIEQAAEKGLNFLLIHEPRLFYENPSVWHSFFRPETNPVHLYKKKLLIDNGICVFVAHSNWDLQETIGMQPSFAKALGFTDKIKQDSGVGVYRIEPITFLELVNIVKQATGMEHLRVQGDKDKIIETVAVGFGNMGFGIDSILVNKADAGIFGELGEFSFTYAREAGVGIIETSHQVSESIGFRSAAEAMQEKLPDIPVEFLDFPFGYEWV